jgi:hypothetical protein
LPSRSRRADTRGTPIIPQNSFLGYAEKGKSFVFEPRITQIFVDSFLKNPRASVKSVAGTYCSNFTYKIE